MSIAAYIGPQNLEVSIDHAHENDTENPFIVTVHAAAISRKSAGYNAWADYSDYAATVWISQALSPYTPLALLRRRPRMIIVDLLDLHILFI